MAGLLEIIARRLLGSEESIKTSNDRKKPVNRIIKVKHVAPIVGPEPMIHKEQEPAKTIIAIDRTQKRERTQREVGREDYLLNQIDEFRDKAQQLQDLLMSKESKVMELQHIVDEREVKAKELEDILNERQRKADGITEEVEKQIDSLIEKVSAKMDEIGVAIEKDLEDGQEYSKQQAIELKESLGELNSQLEVLKGELSEKVHSENVKCYRNIAELFKGLDIKFVNTDEKIISVKKCTVAVIVLTIINMLGLIAFALYEIGVFALL